MWGITGVFVSTLRDNVGLNTASISAVRSTVTVILIGLWLLFTNKSAFKVKIKDLWIFIGSGIFSFTFFTYCYYVSIGFNGMAVSAVLLYTAPIFVSLLSSLIFKTKFTRNKLIALIFSFCGCMLVSELFSEKYRISLTGILVGLGSGIGYAMYTIFGEFAIKKGYKSETITFYTFVFATIATVPMATVTGVFSLDNLAYSIPIMVIFGLLTGAMPYLLYTKGLEKTEPSIAAILATIEPLVACVVGAFMPNGQLTIGKYAGITLILVSLLISSHKNVRTTS